jgi:cell division protein FtsQ
MAAVASDLDLRLAQTAPPRGRPRELPDPEPMPPRPYARWVLLVLLLIVLVAGALHSWRWLSSPEVFPLQAVRLDRPVERVGEPELRAALEPHLNRGMLGLDVAAIRRSLEALPWVASASVRRGWPGTLEIDVIEQIPLARWNGDQALNLTGEVFAPPPASIPEGLPQLAGPPGSEAEVVRRFNALDIQLASVGLQPAALTLDERRSWHAVLNGDVQMQLGADERDGGVRRFVRAYPRLQASAERRLVAVDLRYPNGFALRWEAERGAEGRGR